MLSLISDIFNGKGRKDEKTAMARIKKKKESNGNGNGNGANLGFELYGKRQIN